MEEKLKGGGDMLLNGESLISLTPGAVVAGLGMEPALNCGWPSAIQFTQLHPIVRRAGKPLLLNSLVISWETGKNGEVWGKVTIENFPP